MSSVSGAHRDSRIEGLGGARGLAGWSDGVRVLGVDSVTVDSNVVVGSVSGERMGEGPGNDDTGNSVDTTEGLATDSGRWIFLAILVGDTDRVVSTEGLIVGEGGG